MINPGIRNEMLRIGDVIRNPKNPGGLCCVISAITEKYFILQPFTSRGWPSKSSRLWQWYEISCLSKMIKMSKNGGYSHLLVCPSCFGKGHSLFQAPLRKISIYDETYQCQRCKEQVILVPKYAIKQVDK